MSCSHTDANSTGIEYMMDTFDDSSSTVKGYILLAEKYSPEN
jgi:hypothetical protein